MKACSEETLMEDQHQNPDPRRYLQVIFKKRYLFIAAAAGIITLSTATSYIMPVVYEASTTVSIEKNYLNVLMRDVAVAPSLEQQIQALSIVMTSRSMLQLALADLGIDMEAKSEAETDGLLKHFQRSTQIRFDLSRANRRDADIFSVTYRDRDPRFARDYVNALVKRYMVESLSTKREEAIGANRFLYEQLELYKQKIDKTERELAQRQKQRGVQAAVRLIELQRKYDALLMQYTDKHPEAKRLKDEIDSTRQQVKEQEHAALRNEAALRDAGKAQNADRGSERNVADLERDRDAYKRVYESLVASLGRSEVSAQVEAKSKADMFNILEPATLPMRPVSKPRWIIMLIGIVAGIAGGAGTVILADMMDRTIKSIDTLKEFGLPVIGTIPRIQSVDAILSARRKDVLAYAFAGVYLAGIAAIIVSEYLR
jgi:succinoglycan biosynthesis transport protein ExoP